MSLSTCSMIYLMVFLISVSINIPLIEFNAIENRDYNQFPFASYLYSILLWGGEKRKRSLYEEDSTGIGAGPSLRMSYLNRVFSLNILILPGISSSASIIHLQIYIHRRLSSCTSLWVYGSLNFYSCDSLSRHNMTKSPSFNDPTIIIHLLLAISHQIIYLYLYQCKYFGQCVFF